MPVKVLLLLLMMLSALRCRSLSVLRSAPRSVPVRFMGRHRQSQIAMTSLSEVSVRLQRSAQAVDYTSLLLCLSELRGPDRGYVPSLVENVVQIDDTNVVLGLKGTSSRFPNWLHLCWDPIGARVGIGHPPPRDTGVPYSFASTLRAQLKGLLLTDISIATPNERIVELRFSERINEDPKFKLVVEIMGSRSNVVLVETPGNTINAVAYQVSGSSSVRPLQTGGAYQFPPPGTGVYDASAVADNPAGGVVRGHLLSMQQPPSPSTSLEQEEDEKTAIKIKQKSKVGGHGALDTNSPISKVLVRLYKAMSPNVARALCGPNSATPLHEVTADDSLLLAVEKSVQMWAETVVALSRGDPPGVSVSFACAEDGKFYPFLSASQATKEKKEMEEGRKSGLVSECLYLRDYYEGRRVLQQFLRGTVDTQKRLKSRLSKAEGLVTKLTTAVEASSEENALKAQTRGDLITAYTYAWKHAPGGVIGRTETLECFDFETGDKILIPIPEATSPSQHASAQYKEARKLRRGRLVSEALLTKAQLQVEYLEEVAAALEALIDEHRDILLPPSSSSSSVPMNTDIIINYNEELYRHLSEDLPLMMEIQEEVLGIDGSALLEESSASFRERNRDEDNVDLYGEEDLDAPLPSKTLRGKEKYLAHRERLRVKKSKIVKASEERKGGGGGQGRVDAGKTKAKGGKAKAGSAAAAKNNNNSQNNSKAGRRRGGALAGLTVLESNDAVHGLEGASVVVGRSSKQNDRISFQVAKEHHLWFHADGVPGSHCLLMLAPGQEPSKEALQFAADVAAWHSKAKSSVEASVSYTSPKNLRKVNGGGPGMVTVSRMEGTIYGRPEKGKALMTLSRSSSLS